MLVVCLAIFIGYIWPEINNIKTGSDEKKSNTLKLQAAQKRTSDVDAIINQISTNLDDKKIVDNYLPNSNAEERIIGGINYLANDAGVPLVNISITKSPENISTNATPIVTNATDNNVGSSPLNDEKINKVQFSEATILIVGEYDKINLFIDKLQKMNLFNSIKSLTVKNSVGQDLASTVLSDKTAAVATDQASSSKSLTAEIVVKFGYLKENTNYSDNQIASIDTKLDSGTINVLKLYLNQKDISAVSENGQTAGLVGKKNPFFLE